MSGEDAGFLALELPTEPQHGFMLALLRRPEDAPPLTLDDLRAHLARCLADLPAFRWRVVRVPLDLYHPVFIEDPGFDLEHHVQRETLSRPGGRAELDRLCAKHAAQPMDFSRPLWQIILVDGLSDGRQAILWKGHHCVLDGKAALAFKSRIFSDSDLASGSPDEWRPDPYPGRRQLILGALGDHGKALRRLPRFIRRVARGIAAAKRLREQSPVRVPEGRIDTPYCVLNDAFSGERRYARSDLSLDDVQMVKRIAGVTVNDAVLAVISEALRRYLAARRGLPERSLIANVIVGIDSSAAVSRQSGNQVTGLTTSLCTDVDDLWVRLERIHEVTTASKRQLEAWGPELVPEGLEFVPPYFAKWYVRRVYRKRVRHPERAEHNVTVSNSKGFSSFLTLGPAVVEEAYGGGPPSGGVGVNVTISSYGERLMIGVLSFADAMEDPQAFVDLIAPSMEDLLERAQAQSRLLANESVGPVRTPDAT